ncbi:ParA family protein [Candidatus Regiella insecticola]|uniref:ParA family protein n=1 Tax=Candidatus Regiella insecticola TaxID=138073 RepID=UPI000586EB3C|nr:ParA family protein [Candidatus Regiella insecticola]
MNIITVTNQKGGVGKSTIAVHLAMALQERGDRVLFVELDPQGNASKTLEKAGGVAALQASQLFEEQQLTITPNEGITLINADAKMADIERAPLTVMSTFKDHLTALASQFDHCVIDTPPTLGLRMSSALIVANHVLSPIELEEYSIDGITKMLQTIFGVKLKWNPDLNFLGMLPNRFNSRSEDQKKTLMNLVENYAHLLIRARIGIRSSIPEALSEGIPVWQLKKTSAREAGKEFQEAFKLIFEKMGVAK